MATTNNSINLNQLTFFVVTGASRGIGKSMAIECSRKLHTGSIVMLLARDANKLSETKNEILSINPNISVFCYSIDLTRPSRAELLNLFEKSLNNTQKFEMFKLAFIIHNVGTSGDVKKMAHEFHDLEEFHSYYDINVFSIILLNNLFLELFQTNQKLIVNVTSKCALVPFNSFTLYCSGKSAREMYFRVLAEEQRDNNLLTIVNYSPGPVDTQMTVDIQAEAASADLRNYFKSIRNDNTILTPIQTTLKFVQILNTGNFKSGDHIDFYD